MHFITEAILKEDVINENRQYDIVRFATTENKWRNLNKKDIENMSSIRDDSGTSESDG